MKRVTNGTTYNAAPKDLIKIEVEFTVGTWTTVETRTYDSDHNVLSRTNGLNKTWDMTYDTRGNLLTVTNPSVGGGATHARGNVFGLTKLIQGGGQVLPINLQIYFSPHDTGTFPGMPAGASSRKVPNEDQWSAQRILERPESDYLCGCG